MDFVGELRRFTLDISMLTQGYVSAALCVTTLLNCVTLLSSPVSISFSGSAELFAVQDFSRPFGTVYDALVMP